MKRAISLILLFASITTLYAQQDTTSLGKNIERALKIRVGQLTTNGFTALPDSIIRKAKRVTISNSWAVWCGRVDFTDLQYTFFKYNLLQKIIESTPNRDEHPFFIVLVPFVQKEIDAFFQSVFGKDYNTEYKRFSDYPSNVQIEGLKNLSVRFAEGVFYYANIPIRPEQWPENEAPVIVVIWINKLGSEFMIDMSYLGWDSYKYYIDNKVVKVPLTIKGEKMFKIFYNAHF